MTHSGSIARRLALVLGLCAALFWLSAVGIAGFVIRSELNEAFDQTLRQSALRLLPLAAERVEHAFEGDDDHDDDEARSIDGLLLQGADLDYYVTDRSGRILIFSSERRLQRSEISVPEGLTTLDDAPAYALRDHSSGIGIVVVERQGLRSGLLRESLKAMLWPLAALIPFLIGLVFIVVRAALRPVWTLGNAISKRSGRNLAPLEIGPQPVELAPIAQEVALLLGRLDAALEAERSFAAESAHELRTPIAGALAQVQVLRGRLRGDPNEDFARQAEEALRTLASLSEDLLQTSRLQAGFAASPTATPLGPIIDIVLTEREFVDQAARISVGASPKDLSAYIVPDAFAIVLRNLLRNALIYSEGNPQISVNCGANWITIHNDCTALDADLLAKLTHRFVRGDDSTRGNGLGLAIVSGIVEDCGGSIELTSPTGTDGRGFEAKIMFHQHPDQIQHSRAIQ